MSRWRTVLSTPGRLAGACWLGVYLAAIITGERIDTGALRTDWQVLPLGPLRADPFVSVWHLHIQPPLWNLFIGIAGRWSPIGLSGSFYVLMAVSGAVVAWGLAELAGDLGLRPRGAVVAALVASLWSPVFMNAFVARYELPVIALLVLLVRAASRPRSFVAVPALAGAVVMIRTLYHPVWFLLVVGVWWVLRRAELPWRRVLLTVAIVAVAIGGWMVKNDAQVGSFTLSTWTGMNLLRSVQPAVGEQRLIELHDRGVVSNVALASPFSTFDAYQPAFDCAPGSSLEVIASPDRGTQLLPFLGTAEMTVPNFNYACFVPVFSRAGRDAVAIIRNEPRAWLRARGWSANNWFAVPHIGQRAHSPVTLTLDAVGRVLLLVVPHPRLPASWRANPLWVSRDPLSLGLTIGSVVVIVAALRRVRRARPSDTERGRLVLLLGGLVIGWTAVAGVLGELQEQVRFRSMTDPLVIVLGASVLAAWWRRRSDRRLPSPTRAGVVGASVGVLLLGGAALALREGPASGVITSRPAATLPTAPTPVPPTIATADGTQPVVPRPRCRHIVHLGDSNLALARQFFLDRYAALGVDVTLDAANGRGALTAADGGTSALDAIATYRRTVPTDGRCWVISLSDEDAMVSHRDRADPSVPIRAMVDALGDEPVVWMTPVLASASTDWNLAASTAYNTALLDVVSSDPSISVFDWQDVALDHLDQFQPDGVHFLAGFYPFMVDQVVAALQRAWVLGR